MSYQEYPDWYVIAHDNDKEPVTGEGKRKKKKKKKKHHKKSVDRYSMLEHGNARYPPGMISNQVLPRWHASGLDFLRNIRM
jgi:hypothetical protein